MTPYVWNRAGRGAIAMVTAAAVAGVGLSLGLSAQEAAGGRKEPLVFEVASIKPTASDERGGIVHQPPGGQSYEAIGAPLRTIMTVAYTVTDRQISGGPDWINTDRWTIEAKANRRGTSDELHDALARLLEERFQLKIRHEKRELPVYLLTVDKKGVKMAPHDESDLLHEPIGGRFDNGEAHMTGQNATMNYFAFFLSRGLDMNVVDETNLTGHYDIDYHYVPEQRGGRGIGAEGGTPPAATPEGPDLFTALREQLGLRLEKGKGPVDYLVIESVQKASEN
jgi:uncharacterized protein (TIGR03435 family)